MSAHAGGAAHRGVPLETRLAATARSEWIKFRSVRSGPVALLATVAIQLLGALLLSTGFRNGWATMSAADKAAFDPVYTSLEGILLAQLFVGALGVMTVTGEYTSGLIRGTFLATPQRRQVLAIKALVFAAVVWACCAVLSFAAFFVGQGQLTSPAKHVALGDPGVAGAVLGGGLYMLLVGLLGVFIGVLVRRTPAALAALFGVLILLPYAVGLLPGTFGSRLGEYLPSNAGEDGWRLLHGAYNLGTWPGLGVFAAYVAAAGVAAFALIRRRDA